MPPMARRFQVRKAWIAIAFLAAIWAVVKWFEDSRTNRRLLELEQQIERLENRIDEAKKATKEKQP